MNVIRIGHSAYRGINSHRMCFSKASAIRVLMARGIKREQARAALRRIFTEPAGYTTVHTDSWGVIEVTNLKCVARYGWSEEECLHAKAYWATQPEE